MPRRDPPARVQTDRQALRAALVPGVPLTIRELSQLAGLSEDAVIRHLDHLRRSLEAEGQQVRVLPPECLSCGYVFDGRTRTTKPGKCPECRGTRIVPPSIEIVVPGP